MVVFGKIFKVRVFPEIGFVLIERFGAMSLEVNFGWTKGIGLTVEIFVIGGF